MELAFEVRAIAWRSSISHDSVKSFIPTKASF